MQVISILLAIIISLLLIWFIDRRNPKKYKPYILISLWLISFFFLFATIKSVFSEVQFNNEKIKRYKIAIENLKDIRDSQLAHRTIKGDFQANWDSLVKFIENERFTITQRRDSTVLDEELTRLYGVDTTKDIVIIDTLDFVPVIDSLFAKRDSNGNKIQNQQNDGFIIDNRYKFMMNVPVGKKGEKFKLETNYLFQNDLSIPVFEASVDKSILFDGLNSDLIQKEKEVISVEGVNGESLRVGSLEEVNTNGNWPKNYSSDQ
ncbi:MAG: hypothetical protein CMC83_01300 [Flavobacteriaceae bacterium]|nr:hypothetical protein [Flavobacteriaceae bacterium]|tara:strand:- start:957 stop:1742 length:786 start_codon:yes stop_codon:yes gene_type:complete